MPGLTDANTLGQVVLAEVNADVATNLRDRENGSNGHDCELLISFFFSSEMHKVIWLVLLFLHANFTAAAEEHQRKSSARNALECSNVRETSIHDRLAQISVQKST